MLGIGTVIQFLEQFPHHETQIVKVERLIQDGVNRVGATWLVGMPGDHEDRLLRRQFPDFDGKLIAFNKWHPQVGQHQVKMILSEKTQSLGAVVGFHDLVLVVTKKLPDGLSECPLVVHQQYAFSKGRALLCFHFQVRISTFHAILKLRTVPPHRKMASQPGRQASVGGLDHFLNQLIDGPLIAGKNLPDTAFGVHDNRAEIVADAGAFAPEVFSHLIG
jgi:hypothetical protein